MGTVRQKGNGWELRWYEGGRQRSRMFYGSLRDADREVERLAIDGGSRPNHGPRTLGDAVRRWVEVGGNRKSPTSDSNVASRVSRWVLTDRIADMPLEKVTHLTLEAFYRRLETHLKAGSVNNIRWDISGSLRLAVRDGYLHDNPAQKVNWRRKDGDEPDEVVPPSPDAVIKVLDHLDAADTRGASEVALAMRLALATGARRGEICGLQWGDIIVNPPAVRLVRNAIYVYKPPRLLLRPTKTRVRRTAALPAALLGRLEAFQERWCHPAELEPTAPILRARNGGHLIPDRLDARIAKAKRECGVEFRPLHDLRHLAVSVWLPEMGMQDASRQIGHKRISTTVDIYGHQLSEEADRRGVDAMSRLIPF